MAEIERRTGFSIRVITGDEEAEFDFIGATHNLQNDSGLLIDIGGGSTEIVSYRDRTIRYKTSLPIGSLGLRTRYVTELLPSASECLAMRSEAGRMIENLDMPVSMPETAVIGIGGTFKGATALYNAMFNQPASNVRMETRRFMTMISALQRDQGMTQELAILLMRTVPERIRTIVPGLILADVLARRFHGKVITYSNSGVREGYIYDQILGK